MTTATRQKPQHLTALARGTAIKAQMSAVKRSLRERSTHDGYRTVAGHLESPSEVIARMELGTLLASIRQVGASRVLELTRKAGLSSRMLVRRIGPLDLSRDRRTYRMLTERQRRELARVLREAAA